MQSLIQLLPKSSNISPDFHILQKDWPEKKVFYINEIVKLNEEKPPSEPKKA